MRRFVRGRTVAALLVLLLALPTPVLAGHGRSGQVHGKGHHGVRSPVVIITGTPVFVPALGGGPVLRLHDVIVASPPAVVVRPRGPVWVPGHWQWTGATWVWTPGHWRR